MSRTAARVKQDEVARMIRAIQACGLPIDRVECRDGKVKIVIGGDSGEKTGNAIDGIGTPETVETFEQYEAWRDGQNGGGRGA